MSFHQRLHMWPLLRLRFFLLLLLPWLPSSCLARSKGPFSEPGTCGNRMLPYPFLAPPLPVCGLPPAGRSGAVAAVAARRLATTCLQLRWRRRRPWRSPPDVVLRVAAAGVAAVKLQPATTRHPPAWMRRTTPPVRRGRERCVGPPVEPLVGPSAAFHAVKNYRGRQRLLH